MSWILPKNILKNHKIRPFKGLGQNFLIDKSVLNKIIKAAEIKPTDIILEIGPGTGILTQELAKHAKKVIAIEKDKKMVEVLKETLKDYKNVEIIQGDILKFQITNTKSQKNLKLQIPKTYKIVANLPYYITSSVIRKFLELENPSQLMVLMVQKEVAQRICTRPPKMNLLAVSVQFYAKPEIIDYVSKKSFWPKPKVDSAIIRITPREKGRPTSRGMSDVPATLFFRIVKAGFSHPRKQLVNNLSIGLKLKKEQVQKWLLESRIQPKQRAETLTLQNWLNLTKNLN